jgi:hypothetical protein
VVFSVSVIFVGMSSALALFCRSDSLILNSVVLPFQNRFPLAPKLNLF